ncbi:MAG: 30S ribosome-binding factor RbfA [Pseudomonadota bacterium]
MTEVKRTNRISGLIQAEVSELLLKKIKDPRLSLVTITGVKVSSDLKIARIYFCMGSSKKSKEEVLAGFKSAVGFMRRELGHHLKLRYVPELAFYYDESFDYGYHIDRILKDLHEKELT